MTDTYTLNTDDVFVTTLVDKWFTSKAAVDQLDADMKIESLGKTKLLNEIFNEAIKAPNTDENPNDVVQIVETIKEMLNRAAATTDEDRPGEFFVAMYEAVRRTLNEKEYDDKVEAFVKANTVVTPDADKPKDDELNEMRKARKTAVDNMNSIRQLLIGTTPEWWNFEGCKLLLNEKGENEAYSNLRGRIGERGETGVRLPEYSYLVDNTAITEKKLAAVRDHVNKALSIADVRKAIIDQNEGFDFKNPPEKFEFNLKDKDGGVHNVVARKVYTTTSTEDDSSDELPQVSTEVNEEGDSDTFTVPDAETSETYDDDES